MKVFMVIWSAGFAALDIYIAAAATNQTVGLFSLACAIVMIAYCGYWITELFDKD